MKKMFFWVVPFLLGACAKEAVQQSSVPLDMKTVQEYQQRVATGKTVDPKAKPDDQALNQSDKRPRVSEQPVFRQPVIYPSIGVGYSYHRHHFGW